MKTVGESNKMSEKEGFYISMYNSYLKVQLKIKQNS